MGQVVVSRSSEIAPMYGLLPANVHHHRADQCASLRDRQPILTGHSTAQPVWSW